MLRGASAARFAVGAVSFGIVEEKPRLPRQLGLIAGRHKTTRDPIGNNFRQIRQLRGDYGPARRHRLQGGALAAAGATGHPDQFGGMQPRRQIGLASE